jgi:hypothetical protein
MNRLCRNLGVILVSGALTAPMAISLHATPRAQTEHEAKERAEKREKAAKADEKAAKAEKKLRVYDAKHGVYHDWDANEDRVYRRYLTEKHEDYTDYGKLTRERQTEYWEWRDAHPDRDDLDRDRDRH